MEQTSTYYERLEKILIYLNRILGSLLEDSIPEDKKEIYIAIQYLKDVVEHSIMQK